MSDPYKMGDFLSNQEKEQLKFTSHDRNKVFEKIRLDEEPAKEPSMRFKKGLVYVLTPVAVAALATLVFVQTPIKEQILSSPPPSSGTLTSQYGDQELKTAIKENEQQIINQTAEDKGVKITIKEVFYEGPRITIFYEMDYDKDKYKSLNTVMEFAADGERLRHEFVSGHMNGLPEDAPENLRMEVIELKKELPEEFKLDINIHSLYSLDPAASKEQIKGKWHFTFPVEKQGTEYRYSPTASVKKEAELFIEEAVFSPTGIQIRTRAEEFTGKHNREEQVSYKVYDDTGNELEIRNHYGHTDYERKDGKVLSHNIQSYKPLKEIPDYLVIQSKRYLRDGSMPAEKEITASLPLYLPQNKEGGITVTKLEDKGNEVWVHYTVKGNDPKTRKYFFNVYDKGNPNADGYLEDYNYQSADDSRSHIAKFKTVYSEKLVFQASAPPIVVEELELKVPLNKEDLTIRK
ncbi:DUF4179 domain-containing protein [Metabacillus sp. 84]|uniref:DUF4179 domain-containing protein n=1 Tax=unclassified Metabacillus TaxID=2675274 RepID=UPI003CEFF296